MEPLSFGWRNGDQGAACERGAIRRDCSPPRMQVDLGLLIGLLVLVGGGIALAIESRRRAVAAIRAKRRLSVPSASHRIFCLGRRARDDNV